MPYFPLTIDVNENHRPICKLYKDSNLIGYTICVDTAMLIVKETEFTYTLLHYGEKIDDNIPIYDWDIKEPEEEEACCCFM